MQQPRPGSLFPATKIDGRGDSHFGLHMAGGKFAKWGATLAIELSTRRCYDASVYSGIEFWARGHGSIRPTVKMTQILSTYGAEWNLLAAGGFLLMLLPLAVFFALQRYFVQGLLAGSVKS
jgi:hypothetical protein